MAVDVFDEEGNSIVGEKGELVCTKPFPSMPLGFWNDRGGERYHNAYFAKYPNVRRHGDWCELSERGTMLVYGRSDATLNPGGVRIGTAEIYGVVERIDEVEESVAIGQLWPPDSPTDTRIVLFVKLRAGYELDDALADRIRHEIRRHASPRHVPARMRVLDSCDQRLCVRVFGGTANEQRIQLSIERIEFPPPCTTRRQRRVINLVNLPHLFRREV